MSCRAPAAERVARIGPKCSSERGSAIVEFVFVAVIVLIPLLYLLLAAATVERSRLTVTNAARDVGRAIATAPAGADPAQRAEAALRFALDGSHLARAEVELRYVSAGAGCDGAAIDPDLSPRAEFQVCVLRRLRLPAVPSIVAGRGITTIGRYVVHVDEFRAHHAAGP